MKALVLGSGGREHSIAYMLSRSSAIDRLFWTPANGGIAGIAENPGISTDEYETLLKFVKDERIDLTVIGPEAPLVEGIADSFEENGLKVFGPKRDGAMIEGSKGYAKQLMRKKAIPTASFEEFGDKQSAVGYLKTQNPPFVLKADGLAAGKGVIIAGTLKEAEESLSNMFEKKIFGESGSRVVIEEYLEGEEATVLALCDGKNIVPLVSSQDHKPVYDGDRGPNTGGMGAIAPAPVVNETVMGRVMDRILIPFVEELGSRGIEYKGVIYAGLMIKEEKPYVVEFNCRFGDPEAEAVFPLMESDLCDLMLRVVNGELKDTKIEWKKGFCCDVVIASGGYPGKYEKGKPISGLDAQKNVNNIAVFHAGTKLVDGTVITNGGRVLNIAGTGATLQSAIDTSYEFIKNIRFDNMYYRKDIGSRALKYFS
jgi:phosphoribosylamine--glycine ligase